MTSSSISEAQEEYWIVRHGERYDCSKPFLYRFLNMCIHKSDSWLTSNGDDAARKLGNEMVQNTVKGVPEMIVTSPFLRCLQTAHAIQNSFKQNDIVVPLVVEEALSEFQPIGANRTYLFPDGVPGISTTEKASDMVKRARSAIDAIMRKYKRAIIISHAPIVYHMSLHILGISEAFSSREEYLRWKDVPYLGYLHCVKTVDSGSSQKGSKWKIVSSTINKLRTIY